MIPFRTDEFDLLVVQGTLKSLPQYYNLKESVLQCSAFLMVQLSHSHVYGYWKNLRLTIQSGIGKVVSLLFNMLTRFAIAVCPRSIIYSSNLRTLLFFLLTLRKMKQM